MLIDRALLKLKSNTIAICLNMKIDLHYINRKCKKNKQSNILVQEQNCLNGLVQYSLETGCKSVYTSTVDLSLICSYSDGLKSYIFQNKDQFIRFKRNYPFHVSK